MNRLAAVLAAFLACASAHATVDSFFIETPQGRAERWWPRVAPPKGWHHDYDQSLNYNFNAMAPDGEGFASAEVVMYAKAIRKAREPDVSTLDELVAKERARFVKHSPHHEIRPGKPLTTRDGLKLRTVAFRPRTDGNWERVAYAEIDEHWLLFVLSARSRAQFDKHQRTFERMVWQYRRSG